jgi:uncharacterized protein
MMNDRIEERPRYSAQPLPPYSFVPRFAPHPVRDPRGHMFGREVSAPAPLDPIAWEMSDTYLYGIDLFNHGFYWEAHEAWESLWIACGRRGLTALWLKTLIKLAAGLVKFREGSALGTFRHAQSSLRHLEDLRNKLPELCASYCGIHLSELEEAIRDLFPASEHGISKAHPKAIYKHWLPVDLRNRQ